MGRRTKAFKAMREVLGPESCPEMVLVSKALQDRGLYKEADIVARNQQLLDRLRNTLAGALVELSDRWDPRCGNCDQMECTKKCHLKRLMEELKDE